MIELLIIPLLTGLSVALVSGPLGSFMIWRRMAYFSDTLAHSALLGVALGLFLSFNSTLAIVFTCCIIAFSLVVLESKTKLASDTLLGILSHSALALGLICVSLYSSSRVNLQGLLFGDFLTSDLNDFLTILAVSIAVLCCLVFYWKKLLLITVDEDLAKVEGLKVNILKIILMMLTALVIAISMKVVGVLLITALLIIPAASARSISSSPEAMAILASIIASIGVIMGLFFTFYIDVPAGPAIVVVCTFMFLISRIFSKFILK